MTQAKPAPHGSWSSPITAEMASMGEVRLQQLRVSGNAIYWVEIRPLEGGRYVIVQHTPQGETDVTPPQFNVRTLAHEYGGGSWLQAGATVYFSNFADQRLYRQDLGGSPLPITPEPEIPAGTRYADGVLVPSARQILCVREQHRRDGQVLNDLALLPTDGSAEPKQIAGGHDFYASPRISPDGRYLAWLTWDHPRMPWDGSELWCAELRSDGSIGRERLVAGGPTESIFQPEWGPDGILHFISDRTGWWNLYRERAGVVEALATAEVDVGYPQWAFGYSRFAFLSDRRIACVFSQGGFDHLGLVDVRTGKMEELEVNLTCFYPAYLISDGKDRIWFTAGSPVMPLSVWQFDVASRRLHLLHRGPGAEVDSAHLSRPRAIEYPTTGDRTAHALFYPPTNPDYRAPEGDRPPLIVISHGGPTSCAYSYLDPEVQYFTSRGLAVVDVNYGGSTGYGRAYRERLRGQWGVVDRIDCAHAARYLAERGEVDGKRLVIRGGSAGGYTTLCALTSMTDFAAGVSYYGVVDLETFATDTHKFESHYLESLVGPYPEQRDVYYARSPVHFTDRLSCPLMVFQGLDDKIVPPSQAEALTESLREKRLPYVYLAFEGESHGFRKAETIRRCLEAELGFLGRIFGFQPADDVEPLRIENWPPGR